MTLSGNNREERKRSEPYGYRTPVAGLQGKQYRSKLFVHLHAVIPRLCRSCLLRNDRGTDVPQKTIVNIAVVRVTVQFNITLFPKQPLRENCF